MEKLFILLVPFLLTTHAWSQSDSTKNPFDIVGRDSSIKTVIVQSVDPNQPQDSGKFEADTLQLDLPNVQADDSVTLGLDNTSADSIDSLASISDSVQSVADDNLRVDHDDQQLIASEDELLVQQDSSSPIIEEIRDLSDNIAELKVSNQNILIIFTVLSLLLLAALLAMNRTMINKSYRAIANDNYLRFLFREYKSMPWLYWLFYLLFSLNLGFFLYMLSSRWNLPYEPTVLLLLGCIVIVIVIYLTKQIVLQILSATFPVEKEAQLYGFVTMLINNLLGLILVPINLLVAFAPPEVSKWALWFGIAAIVIFYFFRQLKGLFISGKFIASYQFHFFLYLCTAEIAPLLILGKLAVVNFGFH
ncbi:MAG: DUF4271 domain-containing protein [Saprospiraceae bacterium]|nr:DUF4271 domain-containing protein [Saprospiraceae bacterium]